MDELPLLELFTRLRQAGLPLGIDDYQGVLKALQAGYGLPDRAALARLCRTLWVRSHAERQLFDYYFEQLFGRELPSQMPKKRLTQRQRVILGCVIVSTGIVGIGIVWWLNLSKPRPPASIPVPIPSQPIAVDPSPSPQSPPAKDAESNHWMWVLVALLVLGFGNWLIWFLIRRSRSRLARNITSPESTDKPISKATMTSPFLREIRDEVQVAQTIRQVNQSANSFRDRFVLTANFLPVTQRQMKQSWRYLRQLVREGLPTELDVDATVRRIAHYGMLLEPVLVPPRMNQTELLLLIDQEGSMVAFRALSERLAETASRGGQLGKMGIHYFHNCPITYLYRDPLHLESEPIEGVLAQLRRDRAVVLIFSDAGAARGGLNPERVEATKAFLRQLKPQIRRVAWLNPVPKARWATTSAMEIAQFVPMFEATRLGMEEAINSLRGRHYSVVRSLGDKA